MSDNNIETGCPNCNSIFEVPEEMIGQEVECPECATIFTIIKTEQKIAPPPHGRESADNEENGVSSNTVKVSRTSIGMMPEIDDEVTGLGLIQQRQRNTRTNIKINGLPKRSGEETDTSEGNHWWAFWKR